MKESNARTYARNLPLVPVEGRGIHIRDAGGRWYIDCLSAAGAASLGWSHPIVNGAIERTTRSGAPLLSLDFPTPLRDEFIDELSASLPSEFVNDAAFHLCAPSGANAVEAALILAETATGRHKHISFMGGFHGSTRGARAVSSRASSREHDSSSTLGNSIFLPYPQHYRCPFDVGGEEGVDLAIGFLRQAFADPHSPFARPASIIVECVQGEAGSIPAPTRWLHEVRALATMNDAVLILDEIQTGGSRTGTMWSFMAHALAPDIVITSKAIGGGVPIAVIIFRDALNVWEAGAFTGTFRGGALAFAASAAVLRFMRTEDIPGRVAAAGRRLGQQLYELQSWCDLIGEVRVSGLMIGIEIVDPHSGPNQRGVRPPAPQLARIIQQRCYHHGLIVEIGGASDSVVRLLPPLIISDYEIDTVSEILATCFRESLVRSEALQVTEVGIDTAISRTVRS